MATWWTKLDWFFNWLEHGFLLFNIAAAVGLGALLKTILMLHTNLAPGYITAIWWLTSASFMALIVLVARTVRNRKPPVIQTITATTGGVQLQVIEKFYKEHQGPLLQECEDSVREESEKIRAGHERETFLIRNLATVIIGAFFEGTWYSIFGSQIKALEHLNKGVAKLEDLVPYYNHDLEKRPQYPFESWFGFLKEQVLVRQDGYNVQITVRGKEFLKFLVQSGRTAGDKAF